MNQTWEEQVFQFKYTAMTVKATLSADTLTIKQGIRTLTAPLPAIRGIFVETRSPKVAELIVAVEKSPGKNKIIRTYADVNGGDFSRLVEALVQARPDADLRSLPSKEAYAKLGAVNIYRATMIVTPLVIVVVMAIIVFPFLIHGIDHGLENVSVEMLAAGHKPASRNLALVGALDADHGIVETITRKGSTTTHNYFPMMPIGAPPNSPVAVVLETSAISDAELGQMAANGVFQCVLRNVLWEGLSADNKDFFKTQYGLTLAGNVHLCELGINTSMSLTIFLIAMGVTLLTMVIVIVVFARKQRKAK